jgi:DNA-binding transcriptional ArsR family regulator
MTDKNRRSKRETGKSRKARKSRESAKSGKGRAKRRVMELVNYRLMKALSKPLRVEILAVLCERVASPKQLSDELGEGLSQVSYHVMILRRCGLIVEDHKVPRRGAIEHFYRAVVPTLVPSGAWDNLPPELREKTVSLDILQEFVEDAEASLEAGLFDQSPGELCLTPMALDPRGVDELGVLTQEFVNSLLELQARASKRLREDGMESEAVSTTVFLASFLSARERKDGLKASARRRR